MKEIKLVNVGAALVLFLLSLAILQWATLPKGAPAPKAEFSAETSQSEELPVLSQNEPSKPIAIPFVEKEPSLFDKRTQENNDEPKNPSLSSGKPLL